MKRFLFLLSLIAGVHLAAAPVDRYGQAAELDWPEKVSDDSELRNDLERETKELAGVKGSRAVSTATAASGAAGRCGRPVFSGSKRSKGAGGW